MADPVEALLLDLLEFLAPAPRPYAEVLEAWRTSCPRLPVWEEANARGLVRRDHAADGTPRVSITAAGRAHLRAARPAAA